MAGDDLKTFKVLKDGTFGSIKMIKPGISQVWMIVDNSVVCMQKPGDFRACFVPFLFSQRGVLPDDAQHAHLVASRGRCSSPF
jgi:hypothetical protein